MSSLPTRDARGSALRVRALRKTYSNHTAIDGVDLDVPAGSVFGLLGPNGSGKSTLMRMLLGLTRPTAGSVELLGHPGDRLSDALPDVGALIESPGFHPFLTGRANLRRLAALEPLAASDPGAAVDVALRRVGLDDAAHRRFRAYSLGMKQRLGLAAAIVVPRRLVVLDEPTNGLDPAGTQQVRRLVGELHRAGTTVLLSSHLLSEVEATCSHVAVLRAGRLLTSGNLASMLDARAGGIEVTTGHVGPALGALRAVGAPAQPSPGGVVVPEGRLRTPEVVALLVRAGVPIWGVQRRAPRLEELFAQLTGGPA